MKTIICAAGQGKRLMPYTRYLPKALVSLKGRSIIEYILDSISACGLKDVIITVGYKSELIIKKIGPRYKDCNIVYVYNKDYENTHNLYSMWLSRGLVDEEVVFINGDILFHKDVLKKLLDNDKPDCFVMSTPIIIVDDAMLAHVDQNGNLVEIGKKISRQADGEAIGLYRLSTQTRRLYFEIADRLFKNGSKKVGFVEPLQELSSNVAINAVYTSPYSWVQIDSPADYERAKEEINNIM